MQAGNVGVVFKGKKKKNAQGVWEDAETTVDAWPEVLYIKPGSWADDEGLVKPGATLVSINGAAAPATFALAKGVLSAGARDCTPANPFVELVWRAGAEEAVPPTCKEVSMPVRKWAVLRWNTHWIKLSSGVLSLYDCDVEPSAGKQPVVSLHVADPTHQVIADELNPERARLQTATFLVHVKFEGSAQRQALFDAIEQTVGGGAEATAAPELDRKRFPFQIGKYWLGPMDPTKALDDPAYKGGYGFVMRGINSETGESVCAKINHNVEFEGSSHQVRMHSILEPHSIPAARIDRAGSVDIFFILPVR